MAILKEEISGKTINVHINSSNMKSASYDTETETLSIKFNNDTVYEYYKVPWVIFVKLRTSDSQGKFFSSNIKNNYQFKKV